MSYLTPKDLYELLSGRFMRENVVLRGLVNRRNNYYKLEDNEFAVDLDFGGRYEGEEFYSSLVEVEGFLTYSSNKIGGIYPRLRVKNIKVIQQGMQANLLQELRELLKRYKTMRKTLEDLVQEGFPLRILVIHGKGAQTHIDFKRGYAEAVGREYGLVSFDFLETGLSDEELAETISNIQAQDYNAIFLVRGGGAEEELMRVGGFLSAEAILKFGKPFYLAIGHSLDRHVSLLEFCADQSFDTPSLAGVSLGKAVRRQAEIEKLQRKTEELMQENRFLEKFKENQEMLIREKTKLLKDLEKTKKNLSYAYAVIAILLGLVFFLLLRLK